MSYQTETVGVDPSKIFSNVASQIVKTTEGLSNTSKAVRDFIGEQTKYIKEEVKFKNIVGGAEAVADAIKKGDVDFFVNWAVSDTTPFIARAAAAAAAVGGIAGTIALGGKAVAAIGLKISAASFSKFAVFSGLGYSFGLPELVRGTRHFIERVVELDYTKSTKDFISDAKKTLDNLLKSIAEQSGEAMFRSLAKIIVDNAEHATLEIDKKQLGLLRLAVDDDVFSDIAGALAGIGSQLASAAKDLATEAAFYLGRDFLASIGVVSPEENEEGDTTISGYLTSQGEKIATALDLPEWVKAFLGSGMPAFWDEIWNRAEDKAGIISQRQAAIRYV